MHSISVLAPPLAFAIVLAAVVLLAAALARLAPRKKRQAAGTTKPYACGEDLPTHMIQPNYDQFLPFAFFFTVLDVVALVVATLPVATGASVVLAAVYVAVAVLGLSVLYQR